MSDEALDTTQLLERWYAGDSVALDELLESSLPWIRQRVRHRLGATLRRKLETGDVVQDALLRFLNDGPRLHIRNSQHLRGILARIVENVLRDKSDWFTAKRRALAREHGLPDSLALHDDSSGPLTRLVANEGHDRLRLALELLEPDARQIIVLRSWEGHPFSVIGERLNITTALADTRYRRAVALLARRFAEIERLERADP